MSRTRIMRIISIPKATRLRDPRNDAEIEGDEGHFDFETLLHKISDNPKWNATYEAAARLEVLWQSWNEAKSAGYPSVLTLDNTVWQELVEAINHPKQLLITQLGPQIVSGFGFQPRLVPQILPFCRAVLNAEPSLMEAA